MVDADLAHNGGELAFGAASSARERASPFQQNAIPFVSLVF
jgi:hypothetical protein